MKAYVEELKRQNQIQAQGLQQVLEQQQKHMDMLLHRAQPELTAEQRKQKIEEAYTAINADPAGFVDARAEAKANDAVEKLRQELRNPQGELEAITRDNLAQIFTSPDGRVVRPKMSDPAFFREMISPEMQRGVMQKYYAPGTPPDAIARDPRYYPTLYSETEAAQAARAAKAPPVAAQGDAEAQRQVLQSHGAAPTGGPGRAPGPAPKVDDVAAFKDQIVKAGQGFSSALSGLKWEAGRR